MITYQTYEEIRLLREREGMSCEGIARHLHLDARTVSKWARREAYAPRKAIPRSSILDPYKPAIISEWEFGERSGAAIFRSIRQAGYAGGYSILKSYLHTIRRVPTHVHRKAVLPFEWMLRLLQGKLTGHLLAPELEASMSPDAVAALVRRIRGGRLRARNRALAILASTKGIPLRSIARFLMIDFRMVTRYVDDYARAGIDGLFAPRKGREPKHKQPFYKEAVFSLLHSPPKGHGINRTSWRMSDLKRLLRQQGIVISGDNIRRIIRDAGFRFRSAKLDFCPFSASMQPGQERTSARP